MRKGEHMLVQSFTSSSDSLMLFSLQRTRALFSVASAREISSQKTNLRPRRQIWFSDANSFGNRNRCSSVGLRSGRARASCASRADQSVVLVVALSASAKSGLVA